MRIRFDFSTNGVWLEAEPIIPHPFALLEENVWNGLVVDKGLGWVGGKTLKFKVYRKTDHSEYEIGYFCLSGMPGCCGVCVSHAAYLSPDNRHTGLSQPFRDIKPFIAKMMGYSSMIATSVVTDIPAFKSLLKSNYKICETFTNKRTRNVIAFGFKKI